MFLADHLSRAFLKDTSPEDEEFQVFALELAARNPFEFQGSKLTTNWSHMRLDFWLCA